MPLLPTPFSFRAARVFRQSSHSLNIIPVTTQVVRFHIWRLSCAPLSLAHLHHRPTLVLHNRITTLVMARKGSRPKPSPSLQSPARSHVNHAHNHDQDNAYLMSDNRSDAGVRITRIGLYTNLGMAIGKGVGGYMFNSKALLADAIHSLSDLISDFMTLATVSWSLKPPTERFPAGYGKIESLGALGVSGILLVTGFMMGWGSIFVLLEQFIPGFSHVVDSVGLAGHGHGHDHSHMDLGPNLNAAWLAGGSIVIKEWLYRATLKVARERKSSILASNAYHHRVDSLTAVVALLVIGGSNILNNASWLDPTGGLVISLMVIQAGWGNTREALFELADEGVSESVKGKVQGAAEIALEEFRQNTTAKPQLSISRVQGTKAGQSYLMDLELIVPGTWSVSDTKALEETVRSTVGSKVRGMKRVRVRFVPLEDRDQSTSTDEFISPSVSARSSPEPEENGKADQYLHHHHHHHRR